jgi:diguanylate cyclase (GGDEF)-like protein
MSKWLKARASESPTVHAPREPRLTWQRTLRGLVRSGEVLTPWSTGTGRAPHREVPGRWLAERRVDRLAYLDALTELPNRVQFRSRLSSALERARQQSRLLALLYMDLDEFGGVNDTFGHAAGDELLRAVARRLRNGLRFADGVGSSSAAIARPGDVARLSGDQFTAMLPDIRHSRDAAPVAERLIDTIRQPVRITGSWVAVTPTVGIAIYPKDGTDAETLLRNADAAMYCAKGRRPGTYTFFDPAMSDVASRASDRSPATRCISNLIHSWRNFRGPDA